MEVQDNSGEDVSDIIQAVPGESYPIRLLHLSNNHLIIGYVISMLPQVALILRPYVVALNYSTTVENNIDGYELLPYLDQVCKYDPDTLDPVPFVMSNIISVSIPADHLAFNYENIIQIRSTAERDVEKIVIRKRTYVNNTVH